MTQTPLPTDPLDQPREITLPRRLAALEDRVARIEQTLAHTAPPPAPAIALAPVLAPAPVIPTAPPPLPTIAPYSPGLARGQHALAEHPDLREPQPFSTSRVLPDHLRHPPRRLPQPRTTPDGPSLESLIGKNWTSWVGAIVVVLGVLFFLKYAWDQ